MRLVKLPRTATAGREKPHVAVNTRPHIYVSWTGQTRWKKIAKLSSSVLPEREIYEM